MAGFFREGGGSLHHFVQHCDVLHVRGVTPSFEGPIVLVILENIKSGIGDLKAAGRQQFQSEAIAQGHPEDSAMGHGEHSLALVSSRNCAQGLTGAGKSISPRLAACGCKVWVAREMKFRILWILRFDFGKGQSLQVAECSFAKPRLQDDLLYLTNRLGEHSAGALATLQIGAVNGVKSDFLMGESLAKASSLLDPIFGERGV